MAVVRTVLPRKGIIQPQHGDNYEADLDQNWLTIDSLLQDATDVQAAVDTWLGDVGICGVIAGFNLSTSTTLTPGLTTGVLYAQAKRYAPAAAPNPGAAPASATSYLFYNSSSGFYYQPMPVGANAGDALIGRVTTSSSAVTSVANGTPLFGQVSVVPSAPGNFTVPHGLGRAPHAAIIYMASGGAIWWQSSRWDTTNLYLVASAAGITAEVQLW